MKKHQLSYLFILIISLSTSCKKDDVNDSRALLAEKAVVISTPTISTKSVLNITDTTAECGGLISSDGGDPVTARGICWSTLSNPTLANSTTSDSTGIGSFNSSITGLAPGTTYYVRAYATNSIGTSYGQQVSFTTTILLTIGMNYAGGIIFYIDSTGMHGILCATTDQSVSADWGCPNVAIAGADASALNTGKQNTIDILATCPTATAAKICDTLTLNGYNDWFLPSKSELNLMYSNLHLAGLGNFGNLAYWSSTEMTASFAWQVIFSGGILQGTTKNNLIAVRAAREF
jgi:hypothetical protein